MAFKMSHGVSWHLAHEVVDAGPPQHEHLYSFLGPYSNSCGTWRMKSSTPGRFDTKTRCTVPSTCAK